MLRQVALLVVLCFLGAEAQVANFTQYFNGGLPFCSQCGVPGQYACSPDANGVTLGNWNGGLVSFYDPVPLGSYPTQMVVNIYGAFSCNAVGARLMFGVSLNGYTHGVRDTSKGTNQCRCDTCDGVETFTFTFSNGIPKYTFRATNSLKIVPYKDSICVNRVNVLITYAPITTSPPTPLPESYFEFTIPKEYDRVGCPVCNPATNQWCSASNNNSLTLSFLDPLPSKVYAISVGVFTSLNLIERASSYLTTLTATLQSTAISTVTISESSWKERCGCLGDYQFTSAQYQRGWPAYVYGGANKIVLTANKYSQSYGNVCVGRLALKIVYYSYADFEKYGELAPVNSVLVQAEVVPEKAEFVFPE